MSESWRKEWTLDRPPSSPIILSNERAPAEFVASASTHESGEQVSCRQFYRSIHHVRRLGLRRLGFRRIEQCEFTAAAFRPRSRELARAIPGELLRMGIPDLAMLERVIALHGSPRSPFLICIDMAKRVPGARSQLALAPRTLGSWPWPVSSTESMTLPPPVAANRGAWS